MKLTTSQKIVPLLKAINKEIPWQIIVIGFICIIVSTISTASIPVFIAAPFWDFVVRRLVIGLAIAFVTFLICGFTFMVVEEKILPLFRKIAEHYEKEALEQKKKVLEDAEMEMLKK